MFGSIAVCRLISTLWSQICNLSTSALQLLMFKQVHLPTNPVKCVPRDDIVPDHAADQFNLQFHLLHDVHDTRMDAISVTFYGSMLAVEAQWSIFGRCRLQRMNGNELIPQFYSNYQNPPLPSHRPPDARPCKPLPVHKLARVVDLQSVSSPDRGSRKILWLERAMRARARTRGPVGERNN